MKTNKIMILFFAFALLLVACKKENNESLNNKIDETTQKLIDFKKQLQLKSNEQIPIEDANWYLEGLLNYENANNDHNLPVLEFYKESIFLNSSNGEIDMIQLGEAYNILTDKLIAIQEAKGASYKFTVVDLEIESTNLKDGELKLTMSSALGNLPSGFNYSFGSTDYWIWGEDKGKCGAYTGLEIGSDAADQLEIRMNAVAPVAGYFTDQVHWYAMPFDYDDEDYPGQWNPYMMFDATGHGQFPYWDPPCLTPSELTYYMSKWPLIKADNKPIGKSFISVDVIEDHGTSTTYWEVLHGYEITYGIFHQANPG
jgi:hypothetical protein